VIHFNIPKRELKDVQHQIACCNTSYGRTLEELERHSTVGVDTRKMKQEASLIILLQKESKKKELLHQASKSVTERKDRIAGISNTIRQAKNKDRQLLQQAAKLRDSIQGLRQKKDSKEQQVLVIY
jgi:hypothetical protein